MAKKEKKQKRKASDEKEINGSSLSGEDGKKMMKKKKNEKGSGKETEELRGEEDEGGKGVAFSRHQKRITDPRFSSLHNDPRFKPMSKRRSKMPIDSRFAAIFTDGKFASSAPVDKRGRPIEGSSENHPLRQYYRLSESEDDDGEVKREEEEEEEGSVEKSIKEKTETKTKKKKTEDKTEKKKKKKQTGEKKEKKKTKKKQNEKIEVGIDAVNTEDTALQLVPSSDGELDEKGRDVEDGESDEGEVIPTQLELSDSQISSEEEILSSDDDFSDDIEDEPEEQVPVVEEATRRLAMVNMDWDHIKAVDLYVLMSSFLPEGGQLVSVAIYPSEFGLKSMEEEAVNGPSGIFASDDDEDNEGNGAEIDEARLRAYEKTKLRYYYAVVECDSSATADHLYKECDGVEFERTSNILDLRFIPDTMQFNHSPRDIASEAPSNYDCKDFHTRALQQSKVQLSWDNDEPERIKTLRQKLSQKQLDEMEFKDFLASEDDESDDDNEYEDGDGNDGNLSVQSMSDKVDRKQNKRDKLLALLQSGDGSEDSKDDMDMEITFNTDLEGISKRFLEKENNKDSESVWEAYLRRRREKKKARKKDAKLSSEDDSSDTNEVVADQDDDDFFADEELDVDENVNLVEKKKTSKKKSAVHKEGKNKISETKENVASKEELELLLADDNATTAKVKGYNLKFKKKKGKKKDVISDDELPEVDCNDPRLSALFTSPLYALDPTDPRYKRSAAYLRQASRKQKGIVDEVPEEEKQPEKKDVEEPDDEQETRKKKVELMSLVKSVKRKVGTIHN